MPTGVWDDAITWDAPGLTWDFSASDGGGTGASPPADTAGSSRVQKPRDPDHEQVHWHIDGRAVHLADDWEATITANGGYDQLTASAPRKDLLHAHQGSRIAGHLDDGTEIWFGELDATPAESRLDVAKITATGPVARLRRARGNWLEQSRDYSLWAGQDSDPYGYSATGRISFDASGGRLLWNLTSGTDIKNANANGGVAWFPGEPLTRIAFDWDGLAATTDLVLQILTATGPSGTRTQQGANISLNATSGSIDRSFTTTDDLIGLRLLWNTADATTSGHYRLRVTNLRVNGRTAGDDLSPGQVMRDMGDSLGFDVSRVHSSGLNGLPFYWPGGSWADAFDELAGLDDWAWMVERGSILYGPWDQTWALRFSKENEDLDFLPIYNLVRVFYTSLAGAAKSVPAQAKPDPLARWGITNEYQYDLNQAHASDDVPSAVAQALADELSTQHVVGTITITRADMHTDRHPSRSGWTHLTGRSRYKVRPGQKAHLSPYPDLPPQRIQQVAMHRDDVEVTLGMDLEQSSASRLLARMALNHGRQHGRPRKPPHKS